MLRYLTKIVINRLGYDVRRVANPASIHIAGAGADPITFEYMRDRRGYTVMEVPLADVRAFDSLALPLRPDCHPFVRAVDRALLESSDKAAREAIERVLRSYYEQVRPTSAAEVLSLSWDDLPTLRGLAPHTDEHPVDPSFLPWDGRGPTQIREGRRRTAVFEGLQNGVFARIEQGVTSFGPVQPAKLSLEVSRLLALSKSVKSRGFTRFEPSAPLQVAAFRRGQDYRWVINSGQHRFAVAAAFKIESLPAMVTELVRRDDATYWPQVVSGIFTEAGAKAIFDRMFDGIPANICSGWIDRAQPEQEPNVARA